MRQQTSFRNASLYRRRQRAEQQWQQAAQIARYRAEWQAITAMNPLKVMRSHALLREPAGAEPTSEQPIRKLYRAAAAQWHPDRKSGDTEVFQLLHAAHRIVQLHS